MFKIRQAASFLLVGLLASACNLPWGPAVIEVPETGLPATETPGLAPSLTASMTPTFTPETLRVSVSMDTNCRSGPGKTYDLVGNGLQVGQTAEVLGRASGGDYWIIRDPDKPSVICWLWGQYASLTGDAGSLPVMTPPPTPTPVMAFSYTYNSLGILPGAQCVNFLVTNTGDLNWESFSLNVQNITQARTGGSTNDTFIEYNAWCSPVQTLQDLTPGETGNVSAILHMAANPSGNSFSVNLTLCTGNGLTGTCLNQPLSFVFP